MKKNQQGFTLVEVMITIAIVGIITAVASATYSSYTIAAQRPDGRNALLMTATTLEKCKAMYGVYNSANCSIGNGDSINSAESLYDIGVVSAASTFTLTAVPVTGTSQATDTDCTSIILNNLGQQTGTGAAPAECW